MKYLLTLFLLVSAAFAQDIVVVKRPSTPSATTLAQPTSQIAAWYRYAVYVEQLLTQANANIDTANVTITALKAEIATLKLAGAGSAADITEIKTALGRIETAVGKLTPAAPNPGPVVITPLPIGTFKAGTTITLVASADGSPAPTFHWLKNGTAIPGWTNATLVLPSLTTNDTAEYTAIATNSEGTAQAVVSLTVVP